jgi:hypothetical protein
MSLKAAAVSQVARHKPDRTCPSKPATLRQIAWHAPEIDVSLGLPLNWSPKVGLVGKSLGCEGLSAVLHRAQAFELC